MVALWIGQTIIFSSCGLFFFFLLFFLALSQPPQIGCLPYFHTCGFSANLRCSSETCCMQLAENTGRKKVAKNRHLGTIAQLCRAISLQLRHISTIGKNLSSTCPHNMVNFGLLVVTIVWWYHTTRNRKRRRAAAKSAACV